MSFGGHGLAAFDARPLSATDHCTFVTTDSSAGISAGDHGSSAVRDAGNVVRLDDRTMYRSGCRYEDLVRAADEEIANRAAVPDYDVLVRDRPRFAGCRYIPRSDVRAGRRESHLDQLLTQPPPPESVSTDGARDVASAITSFLD